MRSVLAALAVLMATSTLAHAQSRTIEIGGGTAEQNLLDRSWLTVQTPWRQTDDLREQVGTEYWTVNALVDESGKVVEAVVTDGPAQRRDEARALVLAQRYRPFHEGERIVRARFNTTVVAAPADYNGPPDRSFPAAPNEIENVRIRLIRAGCYGGCPAYELEINGNGQVRYVGHEHVARAGEHRWTIPRDRVAELLEVIRQADYFNLRGYYAVPAFHLPTNISSVRVGEREKFVFNYGAFGELNASNPRVMQQDDVWTENLAPAAVVEVEAAIDRIAGVEPWVGPRHE